MSMTIMDWECFEFRDGFIPQPEADRILTCLWRELAWKQEAITLFGRRVQQPRLTAWYGDPGTAYRYSGLQLEPLAWHQELLSLKLLLESTIGMPLNSVLANAYRDGRDSMGWHSDDESELGPEPVIASLSFGAHRQFRVRRNHARQSVGFDLGHGSLLVMKHPCQRLYQHSVPKTKRPVGLRINLTYRHIQSQDQAAAGS